MIQRIYAGIQCTTCGVRFVLDDEEKTEKYREHLDWHFRQKRREKDETKVSRNRHWYYGVNVSTAKQRFLQIKWGFSGFKIFSTF